MELRLFGLVKWFLRSKKPGGGETAVDDPSTSAGIEIRCLEREDDVGITREDSDEDAVEGVSASAAAASFSSSSSSDISLQSVVKRLHFGGETEKESAATHIRELLARDDTQAKGLLCELGVVEPLVNMLAHDDHEGPNRRSAAALGALRELSRCEIRMIKVQMMDAGILMRLPQDLQPLDQETVREFSEIILGLSSVKNTPLGPQESARVIEFTIRVIESDTEHETKASVLGAIYHFSSLLENAARFAMDRVVDPLLRLLSEGDLSEKALAVLGNLVVTSQGKKALVSSLMAPENLIDILTWEKRPKCQEMSVYILMILAHQNAAQRAKMVKSGIVPVLLELALLGRTALIQRRALKLLQWFKDERGARVGPHSGPQAGGRSVLGSPVADRGEEVREGRMMMQKLVKESLRRNMEVITRRANNSAVGSGDSGGIKALVLSTSSNSLPY
ncbi:hypothetical protein MLD38_039926 [Melastoma candidum]|uniref:Uncharacterized protein n=1 Tax=Melastoma candidum TaxID=119954 RepID=A0ACB9L435_9MYRT|nr:hypothetical protein MLD38_039926 [Melastoma candidum]